MDHFLYRDGALFAEDVPVAEIAAAVGTPFYVYSTATLLRHFQLFDDALAGMDHLVCYAMKAASNQAILKTLAQAGAGMDVVSQGEYLRAKAAGVPGDKIVFSGVGKTAEEIRTALSGGIRQFNVESEPEMEVINAVALDLGVVAPITVRVNPDVDAKTHAKIATGKSENKFGIPIAKAREVYAHAATLKGLDVIGIDVHIGSQLTELEPFRLAYQKVAELTETLRADGHDIRRLDLGGGLGIPYTRSNEAPPLPVEYGQLIKDTLGHLNVEIEIEPVGDLLGLAPAAGGPQPAKKIEHPATAHPAKKPCFARKIGGFFADGDRVADAVEASDCRGARGRADEAEQEAEERGFPGSVGTEQSKNLPFANAQGALSKGGEGAVAF